MSFDSSEWYVYNPRFNAPMTEVEHALNGRLQSGDPELRADYEARYGPQEADGSGGWFYVWCKDQDYWNARYLNQLASPEQMVALSQATIPADRRPYYTLHHLNAIRAMKDRDAYFATFVDQNLAEYLKAVLHTMAAGVQVDLTKEVPER